MPRKRYILLDRDGTVIVNKHYQRDPAQTELVPQAEQAITRLKSHGYGLVMVSNQSGIGRGLITQAEAEAVNRSVALALGDPAVFDGMYYCPHQPEEACSCRKPATGLVLRAAEELGFNPNESVMVGDSFCDVQLGKALGIPTVLLVNDNSQDHSGDAVANYVASDLDDAARWIVENYP